MPGFSRACFISSPASVSLRFVPTAIARLAFRGSGLRRADFPWLASAILAGGVAGPVMLMFGLAGTPASTASLLLNLEGLLTMIIAWIVFHENADARILMGAAAILAGAGLLSWQGGLGGIGWSALAIAGACLAWAIDNNLTRKISGGGSRTDRDVERPRRRDDQSSSCVRQSCLASAP